MKATQLIALCLGLVAGESQANVLSTLTWSAQDAGGCLSLTNGSPLAVGSTVRLGYFDLEPTELESLFTDPAALNSHFTVLATAHVGSFEAETFVNAPELDSTGITEVSAPGCFASSVVFTSAANTSELDGKRCYVWAMNGATVAASSHHGIFSHQAWILNSNRFGATQWDLSQVSATNPQDVILGHRGPQISQFLGGTMLRLTNTAQLKVDVSDVDADGTPALLEEAFAMNPTQPDSSKLPKITTAAGRAALSFTRRAGGTTASDGAYTAEGLRYVIEMSADLKTWAPCASTEQPTLSVQPGTESGTEDVTLALTPENLLAGCQFARVRIERVQ
jgi:hypothetical protein